VHKSYYENGKRWRFFQYLRESNEFIDRLRYYLENGMQGPGTSASICHMYAEKIYIYDPSTENANFGFLHWFSTNSNENIVKRRIIVSKVLVAGTDFRQTLIT